MRRKTNKTKSFPSSQAGVTLIELMVSTGLMVLVIGAALAAFMTQNRALSQRAQVQQARDSARDAISAIERRLHRAGFGMNPEFVFFVEPGEDIIDEEGAPDELIFHSRSPRYFAAADPSTAPAETRGEAWNVANAAGNNINLVANGSDVTLLPGHILLVLCPQAFTYAYVTVEEEADFTGVAEGDQLQVDLRSHQGDDPFRQNNSLNETCFSGGAARAFLIERFRFFVDDIDGRPYLFLDRGFEDADEQIVAPDIEDLQVAYITRNGNEWGGQASPNAEDLDTGSLAASSCSGANEITQTFYQDRAIAPCVRGSPRRNQNHIGNIQQVRVSVVGRTPRPIFTDRGVEDIDPAHIPSAFSVENRDRGAEDDDGFRRYRLTITVNIPAMGARGVPSI